MKLHEVVDNQAAEIECLRAENEALREALSDWLACYEDNARVARGANVPMHIARDGVLVIKARAVLDAAREGKA